MKIEAVQQGTTQSIKKSSAKKQPKINMNTPKNDTYELNIYSENMSRIKTKDSFKTSESTFTGTINNKNAYFESKEKGIFNREYSVVGKINETPISFNNDGKVFSGKYGDVPFELEINIPMFKKDSIKGIIGEKEIDLTLPGSKAPQDEVTKDILTSVLCIKGYKPVTTNGTLNRLSYAEWMQKNLLNSFRHNTVYYNNRRHHYNSTYYNWVY